MSDTNVVRVAVIIRENIRFLLVQEAVPPFRAGLWNWVQGAPDAGEDLKRAAIREVKEETNFDVELEGEVVTISNPFSGTKEIRVYEANRIGGKLKLNDGEILDARWFTLEEIENMRDKLAGNWILETLKCL